MLKQDNITEFFEENKQCPYFEDKKSDTRYKFIQSCDTNTYSLMLQRGWRRFGRVHFVPECANCNECKTIRIDINNFKYSKSQKRLFSKNKDLDIYVQKPSLSIDHISLFNKYHKHMKNKKNWNDNLIEPSEYKASYVDGAGEFGKEILYFLNDKLIAVALCDITKDCMSSVYCFYDHDYEKRSLGKYSIITQISMAKQANIEHLFLGYWIKDHFSMGYKEDYQPFDILQNRPKLNEPCIWEKYEK